MKKEIIYVGMDVHAADIAIAVAELGRNGEIRPFGTISSDLHIVERAMQKLGHPNKELRVCYEAGPCGFVIARRLSRMGIACTVAAPSLIPRAAGDKIKTDRKDARMLARLHRAGELTAVHVPDERDEAVRDLCRARTDAVRDLGCSRQQLKAFLLRNGYHYRQSTSWTDAHLRYLRELVLPHPAMRLVLEEYLQAVSAATERIERIEQHMEAQLPLWHMEPAVKALAGFRGCRTIAAMIIASEIGDIHRFAHPRQLMAFLGLVPSENSSGTTRRQGGTTKAGNGHLRWIMNECALHYRKAPKVSSQLSKRQQDIDKLHRRAVQEISWRCQNRLHQKGRKLAARGKISQKVQTAMARELTGFVWEVMKLVGQKCGDASTLPFTKNVQPKSRGRDYLLKIADNGRKSRFGILDAKAGRCLSKSATAMIGNR